MCERMNQANDQIEITPEMIKAGINALSRNNLFYNSEEELVFDVPLDAHDDR